MMTGKNVSESLKKKNKDKEYASSCHQTALKSMSDVVDLSAGVCPLIDDIGATVKSEYNFRVYCIVDIYSFP